MVFFKQDDPAAAAEKARIKQQQAEAKKQQQEEADRQRRLAEFQASPPGRAREAYERGDLLFQFSADLSDYEGSVVTMASLSSALPGAYNSRRDHLPSDTLNAVCNEGWDLHSFSTAFVQTGEESRDKFLASGQHTAITGKLVGTYVFTKAGSKRNSGPFDNESHT